MPVARIAIIQVPRLGINVAVAEGDVPQQLRNGPGHRTATAAPGTVGNSVIVGHADDWGGPFGRLDELKKGDLIAVQVWGIDEQIKLPVEQTAVYEVQETQRNVRGDDVSPFATSDDYRLTLMTGDGDRLSDERFVVTAVSGKPGRVRAPPRVQSSETTAGSMLLNSSVVLL